MISEQVATRHAQPYSFVAMCIDCIRAGRLRIHKCIAFVQIVDSLIRKRALNI